MIAKLDNLVEAGRGDEQYKDLFYEIMRNLCENHSTMREQVKTVIKFSIAIRDIFPPINEALISSNEGIVA